jgi:hypothetical protein
MIALGVAPAFGRHASHRWTKVKRPLDRADRRRTAVDFPNVVHAHMPAFADDLAMIRDLSTRFRVERRLAKHHRDPPVAQMPNSGHRCIDFDRVVTDELRIHAARARRNLPRRDVVDRLGGNA